MEEEKDEGKRDSNKADAAAILDRPLDERACNRARLITSRILIVTRIT